MKKTDAEYILTADKEYIPSLSKGIIEKKGPSITVMPYSLSELDG